MLARPLQLGPVTLETNLMLAPIAGWCELAWRETARSLGGVGLACTDLLSPKGLICGSEATADLARTSEFDQPIGMQLYGGDPRVLAEGARWCADHGATVVDINMGCPVDKVCKKDGGVEADVLARPGEADRGVGAFGAARRDPADGEDASGVDGGGRGAERRGGAGGVADGGGRVRDHGARSDDGAAVQGALPA